jgi:hypothetical protein
MYSGSFVLVNVAVPITGPGELKRAKALGTGEPGAETRHNPGAIGGHEIVCEGEEVVSEAEHAKWRTAPKTFTFHLPGSRG